MSTRPLLSLVAVAAIACGSDDPPATIDAAGSDGATAIDAASDATPAIDAAPGPDAPPGAEPTLVAAPCGSATVSVEYYSCAFFIGGGDLRVGDTIQFTGCAQHTVRSGAGVTLIETFGPVCYRATSPGTLTYACQQHPANSGSVTVAP